MKIVFHNRFIPQGAILALAMVGLLGSGAAHALGTLSGTSISNLATLNYSVGATAQSPIGSSAAGNTSGAGTATSFLVDNKVNLSVTTSDTTFVSVVPGQTIATASANQVATFLVTNTGNTTQDFALTSLFNYTGATANVFGLSVTDTFDPSACSVKVKSGSSGGYVPATDTATFIDELAPDASKTVYVICAIPLAQVDGDIAVIALTAEARAGGVPTSLGAALTQTSGADTAGVDIVFADGAGTDDLARDAKHSSRSAFKVVSAKLTVTKLVALVCDPFNGSAANGAKNIPGSYVRYTISIANTGAASAILGTISDTLVSTLAFDPDLIAITSTSTGGVCAGVGSGGTATSAANKGFNIVQTQRAINNYFTTANDSDGADLVSGVVTITFATVLPVVGTTYAAGELKVGESVSVIFQVKIN